ncbi:MAG: PIN domain-containing protein [Schlesneria sp.]
MITAVDSSVLWSLIKQEAGWQQWQVLLQQASTEGPLLVCPIVFAELAPSAQHEAALTGFLNRLQIAYDGLSPATAFLAGDTFRQYRLAGGPRQYLVPDFLIAAHATNQANRLAAVDRGYLRKWFPNLVLLQPESG